MMQIEGLNNVIHRIDELNQRFGLATSPYNKMAERPEAVQRLQNGQQAVQGGSFAGELAGAMKAASVQEGAGLNIPGDTNSMIAAAARKYNVDPRLAAAVAQTESGGNQETVSPAGAIGVMQLMPETAAGLGVNPYDKQQNIEGGVKYLRQMMDTFGGDVQKAVAAYNAGPQAVRDYNGIPPYRETQNYVNKVLDIYR